MCTYLIFLLLSLSENFSHFNSFRFSISSRVIFFFLAPNLISVLIKRKMNLKSCMEASCNAPFRLSFALERWSRLMKLYMLEEEKLGHKNSSSLIFDCVCPYLLLINRTLLVNCVFCYRRQF